LKYTAICKIYQIRIIVLQKGYVGYNAFNIFTDDDYNPKTYGSLFILYVNNNHYDYLDIKDINENENYLLYNIDNEIKNNIEERKKLRKNVYPFAYKWYPDIYKKMFSFYKFNIIPEERFKSTSNPSQYTIRFKELAKKSFYVENNRLYFIKDNKTERLEN
jgi:hypothetical protein